MADLAEVISDPTVQVRLPLHVGEALLVLRRRAGLTQTELASISGLSKNTISSIERNEHSVELSSIVAAFAAFNLWLHVVPLAPKTEEEE